VSASCIGCSASRASLARFAANAIDAKPTSLRWITILRVLRGFSWIFVFYPPVTTAPSQKRFGMPRCSVGACNSLILSREPQRAGFTSHRQGNVWGLSNNSCVLFVDTRNTFISTKTACTSSAWRVDMNRRAGRLRAGSRASSSDRTSRTPLGNLGLRPVDMRQQSAPCSFERPRKTLQSCARAMSCGL
jgi:hypothetical protein